MEIIKANYSDFDAKQFGVYLEEAVSKQKKVSFEISRDAGGRMVYYQTEITPICKSGCPDWNHPLKAGYHGAQKQFRRPSYSSIKNCRALQPGDWLTQSYNRYFFDERLQQEIDLVDRLQAYGPEPGKDANNFGLIMFDIDFFKIYNDLNGHLAGDELLQTLVAIIDEVLFPTDILCRYGGEEFAVICCQTSSSGIKVAAEKIRKTVENYEFMYEGRQPGGNLTVSVGAAYCSTPHMKRDDLIKAADNNLYLRQKHRKEPGCLLKNQEFHNE